MTARTFAAFCGALYLALGLLGFVPAMWERAPRGSGLSIHVFHASLFGVFVVNIILSMVHLVLGLWGVMAANDRHAAVVFARGSAVVFAALGVAGLVPVAAISTAYGTMPLSGHNAWLHLASALAAGYFAFRPGYRLTQIGLKEEMNPHRPHG